MFLDLASKRRSIRKFQDKDVEQEKLDRILEAALRSPSSMDRKPWEFILVRNRELLAKLAEAKPHGSAFLKNAPAAVVVCADPSRCDVWIEDASIASIYILLAAESLGLGGCWIQIRERMHDPNTTSKAYVAELLGLPDGFEVESIVALGYPGEKKDPHPKESLDYQKIHFEKYGSRNA
ncbi:MAG: nitroreductase family protein [Deltaproteobacteria bacterium]|nr:nitroreductase family protein [Deltaproteobacteria bacterium]MBW2015819.1 nitroreductase family protein [Deltaproteobacteria bacterium]MBW2128868.1 nitroreductase family protein [Deltaproteobacteria bacterium]MBW2304455.1 nitroreductase family protein [Deltaproteobacteria bacterium]